MFESDPSCFRRAQAGCQESLNALLRQHEGLVQAAVRSQVTGGAAFEDLLQAGREGLWRAILGFEPQRGTRFATYAWPSIVRAIWGAARARPLPPVGLPPDPRMTLASPAVAAPPAPHHRAPLWAGCVQRQLELPIIDN